MAIITIFFQPSPVIDPTTIAQIKVFRKATTATPDEPYLVEDWVELPLLVITGGFDAPSFTDTEGDLDYWYRTQTFDAVKGAPMGPLLPGHGNSTFASLRAGYGYLSDFTPNAIDLDLLYDEVHKATEYVVEDFLRPKFSERDINDMYLDPLPAVRMLTEIIAARSIIMQLKPTNKEQIEQYTREFSRLAKQFGIRKSYRTRDLTEKESSRSDPPELLRGWGR